MGQAAAKTGAGPMAMVAIEQLFPKDRRIVVDDLAYAMLPFGARAFLWLVRPAFADWMVRATERRFPGLWGGIMCRKRYIDEKLIEAAGQIDAVVNLGAGFDTRAYRMSDLAGTPVWEVDQAENINRKRARLQKLFGAVPANVTLVSINFDREELGAALATHGYAAGERTFFLWEAVTQYLTETGVSTTFDFLASAARGSRLAFTYVCKDFVEGRNMYGQEHLYRRYVGENKIWLFGMDPQEVSSFLEQYGWALVEHLDYRDLAARYIEPTGRQLTAMAVERMAYAEKM
jgi:methyltransferase (TIGR00027 family)